MSPSRAVLLLPIVLACFHEAGGRAPAPRHVGPVERPLPVGAIARLGSTRLRHDSEVRAVTFSPDGRKIASVDSDQKARIWDALTGRMLNEFDTPEIFSHGFDDEADHTFVFTPDGKKLAAGVGADICFWDVQSGQEVRRFHGEGEGIRALTVSSDSKTFYCGGDDNKLHQWDIATGKHIRSWDYFGAEQPKRYANGRPHKKAVLAAVSPDGKSAVWHVLPVREHNTLERREDGPLVVWNVATRKEQWRLKGKEGKDFRGPRVAFSREGAYLTAYDEYSPLTVWHAASGKVFEKLGDKSATSWVAYSPDSRRVAVLNHAEGQGLRMWDLASGKELWKREQSLCMSGSGTSLTFAPDGKTLALANRNNVLLWDAESGKEKPDLEGHRWGVRTLRFSPKGDTLISSDDASMCEWSTTGRLTFRHSFLSPHDPARCVPESCRARLCVYQPKSRPLQLRELISDKLLGEFKGVKEDYYYGHFSADGRTRVIYSDRKNPEFIFLDVPSCTVRSRLTNDIRMSGEPTLSADGKWLAVPCLDRTVLLIDSFDGKVSRRLGTPKEKDPRIALHHGTFSPDGRFLAFGVQVHMGVDKSDFPKLTETPPVPPVLLVWHVPTGRSLRQFDNCLMDRPHSGICSLEFSPDNKNLAMAVGSYQYRNQDSAPVLEVASGQPRRRFGGHSNDLLTVAFSPDGKILATGSLDTTVLLWDMKRRIGPDAAAKKPPAERLRSYWADLASDDSGRAYDAILAFEAMPGPAVAFLVERLKPAPPIPHGEVAKMIADLGGDTFEVRERASARLLALHEASRPAVTKALAGKVSSEGRRRLRKLLHALDVGYRSPARLRELRAVESLERIGTLEARRVLKTLAAGASEAILTREARESLARSKPRGGGE